MPEIIRVNPISDQILMTQRVVREGQYFDLVDRARRDLFTPDPPVILSRMPTDYNGRYKFHLYHGTHRFVVAQQAEKDLNGLVVSSASEIPDEQALRRNIGEVRSPDERLTQGLKVLLKEATLPNPIPTESMSLTELLKELQRQEGEGRIPVGLRGLYLLRD